MLHITNVTTLIDILSLIIYNHKWYIYDMIYRTKIQVVWEKFVF